MDVEPVVAARAGARRLTTTAAAPAVAQRLSALRQTGPDAAGQSCLAVRDLVVVCSSSRGGSSLFGEVLRRSPDLLTFSAEINPHVTISTLGSGGGCDVVADPAPFAGEGGGLQTLRVELGNDLGRPGRDVDIDAFSRHVAWRLTMQWPGEQIDAGEVAGWVDDVLAAQPDADPMTDRAAFALALLRRVQGAHPAVNPYRYDIPDPEVAAAFPEAAIAQGPTAEPVVEMAPFVLPRVWQVVSAAEASTRTVVATTPRNAFRLPLLARAFPNATVRVVHLVRNPAASVNGLRDGWLHRGFFSCRSEVPLAIAGYTDAFPAWGAAWWNYDVPPGWREWVERPLTEVCGFQWHAAHTATLHAASRMGLGVHRVAMEDLVGSPDRRADTLRSLAKWLGVDPAPLTVGDELPVVMPTAPPLPRRWTANAGELAYALEDPGMLALARQLGYGDPITWQ